MTCFLMPDAQLSSTTYGTCYTSTTCSTKTGTADGNCAAGFGVCCLVTSSTCGTTISTNTSYIRNPGYPSSYTPTYTGSCEFKVSKVFDDICQLRLDFQTMSGFAASVGVCSDSFKTEGQTGKNPPSICGTNTGYHMYTEFGATSDDSITVTIATSSTMAFLAPSLSLFPSTCHTFPSSYGGAYCSTSTPGVPYSPPPPAIMAPESLTLE